MAGAKLRCGVRLERVPRCGRMGDGGHRNEPLGRILIQHELITEEDLQHWLRLQQRAPGERLGAIAMREGALDAYQLLRALSDQHGVPGIDLSQLVIPVENLKLIPRDVAESHLVLPFSVQPGRLMLAMADPHGSNVLEEVSLVTGRDVFPYVAASAVLSRAIGEAYRAAESGLQYYIGPDAPGESLAQLGLTEGASDKATAGSARTRIPDSATVELSDEDLQEEPEGAHDLHSPATGIHGGHSAAGPSLDPAFDSRVAPLPSVPHRPSQARRSGRKVLLVDDEEDIRRMLRRVLSKRGFEVVEAARGSEALLQVRAEEPDCLLLDAMLPEVHGFDICRRIKVSPVYTHIPIIMISAEYRGWRVKEDLKASYGVFEFLEKPFTIGDVVSLVERALAGRQVEDTSDEISEEASRCLTQGIEAYRDGDIDVAIGHLRRGVGLDPLSFRLHYHLGLLYGRRDQLFDGIQSLETAADLSPRNFSVLKNLAVLYQRAGFKNKAIEMWERALSSAPDVDTRQGIRAHLLSLF